MWLCKICNTPIHDDLINLHVENHVKKQEENKIDKDLSDALDNLIRQGFIKEVEGGFKITEKGIEEQKRRNELK